MVAGGKWRYLVLPILVVQICFIPATFLASDTVGLEDAERKVYDAFKAVVAAYQDGGSVGELVEELNEALVLLSEAGRADSEQAGIIADQAYEIAEGVESEAPRAREEGMRLRQNERIGWAIAIGGVILGVLLIYFVGPRLYWSLWLRIRRDFIVKASPNKRQKGQIDRSIGQVEGASSIISGEVWSVVIAVVVLVTIFGYTEFYFSRNVVEPFSEFGILGPNMTIANYPRNVTVGDSIHLNVYVANHLGRPTYYVIMVKLREKNASLNPASGSPDLAFNCILLHGEERVIPVNVTIESPGLNQRLVFELWLYDESNSRVEYHDRSLWIWISAMET